MNGSGLIFIMILGFSAILTSSCQKETAADPSEGDHLIFGHFYGECGGETCIEIFKLANEKLYEDTNDRYPGSSDFYNGDFIELHDSLFQKVRDLPEHFPIQLLEENSRVIGMPDAGDWGGLYIEYKNTGTRQFWLIDKMKSNIPEYLFDFSDKVNEAIQAINN